MLVEITNVIKISNPTDTIKQYCKTQLTYKNPDYEKKRRMGFYVAGTPKELKLYDVYDGDYYLPIGCLNDVYSLVPPPNAEYKDYSITKSVEVESDIKLRSYQEPCVQAVKEYFTGLLIMRAGVGKTVTALQCFGELKQKTLWLTHTQDLLNQAKEECENNIRCKTSTITKGKCDYSGDIVFATIQTLVNVIDKGEIPQDTFGMIIGDEIQHCIISAKSVMQFQKCMSYFAARYKVGLTATLHTSNGLHVTIPKLIGPVIYELKKEGEVMNGYYKGNIVVTVPTKQFQIPAEITFVPTKYTVMGKDVFDKYNQTVDFSKLLSSIAEDEERNELILNLLTTLKGSTIIVSDRTSQLQYLAEKLGDEAFYVDGKTKKKDRERGLNLVREGKVKYLFATYKLICEGFNAPILENLVMATPVKDLRIVIQSIGRVQRPYKGKDIAKVYDIVDDVGKLDRFLKERKRIYKKEGYVIHG